MINAKFHFTLILNIFYMELNLCSRCGRCCIEFEGQIHFTSEEILHQKNPLFFSQQKLPFNPYIELYNQIQTHWEKKNLQTGQIDYYIPSKRQIWKKHFDLAQKFFLKDSQNSTECLFLAWNLENGDSVRESYCIIHGFHPNMCRNYPSSKGNVCKNHQERKYTMKFLQYQREKISFAIEVLKLLYQDKITFEFVYDVLTLLMDFGNFNLKILQKFFQTNFKISDPDWTKGISQLLSHQLVTIEEEQIQGISLKETEYLVDRIMEERGWHSS
ncbi:MAG: hypothetical protein DRO88_08395 [Promethearchaeia archaeon]|nr:MAG: hypothetical protein DRO88_08395 [Candidatus Lokiarchaeia archaeon]